MTRREVRVAGSFFERLDELLPGERGPEGTPSSTDFLLHEMPAVIDRLADDFFGSTLAVAEDPEIRVLITAGVLVDFMPVYVVLAGDGSVEVIYLELG